MRSLAPTKHKSSISWRKKEIRQTKNRSAEFVVQQSGFACPFGLILFMYRRTQIVSIQYQAQDGWAKKSWIHAGFRRFDDYPHSTKSNQFCLEIILCHIRGAFDYLMYPYYPVYMG